MTDKENYRISNAVEDALSFVSCVSAILRIGILESKAHNKNTEDVMMAVDSFIDMSIYYIGHKIEDELEFLSTLTKRGEEL